MIINQLTVENFAGFEKETTIHFYEQSKVLKYYANIPLSNQNDKMTNDNLKHIVATVAQNGVGKTTIKNAILTALYGKHSSFSFSVGTVDNMTHGGEPIKTRVEMKFVHKGTSYHIERIIYSRLLKSNDKVHESEEKTTLIYQNLREDAQTKKVKHDIDLITNSILPIMMAKYVLFDGEDIKKLFSNESSKEKNEFNQAIYSVLGMNKSNSILRAIKKGKEVHKSLASKDNIGQHATALKKENQIANKMNVIHVQNENLQFEMDGLEETLNQLRVELDGLDEYKTQIERRKELESQIIKLEEQKKSYALDLKKPFQHAHLMVARDTIERVYERFTLAKEQLTDGDIDFEVGTSALEKTLLNHSCEICETDIPEGSAIEEKITSALEVRKANNFLEYSTEIMSIHQDFKRDLQRADDEREKMERTLKRIEDINDELEPKEIELDRIKSELDEILKLNKEETIQQKKKVLDELTREVIKKQLVVEQNEKELTALTNELTETQKIRNDLIKRTNIDNLHIRIFKAFEEAEQFFEKHFNSTKEKIRLEIEKETNDGFQVILRNHKDRKRFNRVEIDEKFNIRTISDGGAITTDYLSSGQQQMLLIIFITSVVRLAGFATREETMPLILDTAFARLDDTNRVSLIRKVSEIATQTILLAIEGSEYTPTVHRASFDTGKLHRINEMSKNQNGDISINEITEVTELEMYSDKLVVTA